MIFRREQERQLVAYMQEAYGELLSLFLLSGLGEEEGWSGLRYFTVAEVDWDEKSVRRRLAMTSDGDTFLPHGSDPLVLTVLLKLLRDRGKTHRMKCRLVDVMAALGWEDSASARKSVTGAIERYYAMSLGELAPSQGQYFGESPTFSLCRRILVEHEIHGTHRGGGEKAYFGVTFNPDFVGWLGRRILLGIDWKRVVALEV